MTTLTTSYQECGCYLIVTPTGAKTEHTCAKHGQGADRAVGSYSGVWRLGDFPFNCTCRQIPGGLDQTDCPVHDKKWVHPAGGEITECQCLYHRERLGVQSEECKYCQSKIGKTELSSTD